MSEKSMSRHVMKVLKELHPVRIETSTIEGFPDVNHAFGCTELKFASRWPVRPETPLRMRHATHVQRNFWRDRAAAGGKMTVLLKVASDWLLFDGPTAAEYLGFVPKSKLEEVAIRVWRKRLDGPELVGLLRRGTGD